MRSLRPAVALSLAGAALLWLAPPARAQSFSEERYTTADGLPSDLVKAVARDRHGFVWVATDGGLARYDGVRFTRYDAEISFPFGKDLLLTRAGRLLALGDAGLVEIAGPPHHVSFRRLVGTAEAPGPRVLSQPKSLYEDHQGRLWVSEPGSIVRIEGQDLVRYEMPPFSHSASFLRSYCLAEDESGTLWAAAQMGAFFRFEDEADRFVPLDVPWPVTVVHQLRDAGADRLWAATSRGLYEIRVQAGRVRAVVQLDDAVQVSSVGHLGADLFLGTYDLETLVGRLEGGRFVQHDHVHVFLVQRMLEDGDRLWLSTDEGLVVLRATAFEALRFVDEDASPYLISFVQTADGTLYASDRSNVYRLTPDGRRMRANPILDEPTTFLLGLRTDGRFVWAAQEGGLLEFDGDRLVRRIELMGSYATDLEEDADGRLWLIRASGGGVLCIFPDGERREYGVEAAIPVASAALDQSPDGEVLVATSDPGRLVLRYDAASESFVPVAGLPFAPGEGFNVYDLDVDGEGRYWVASTEGLLEVGREGVRRIEIGFTAASPAALAVVAGDDGRVWFATTEGVVRLDPETGHHHLFDERAGLPSKLVGVRDLFASPGGGLTAVTARGTARLVRKGPSPPPPPAPVLLEVRVNDQPVEPGAPDLEVPHGGFLALTFVSPYFGHPLQYQERLLGREESWRTPQSRNELLLAGLDSGDYTLQVRAILPGSDEGSAPTALSFAVGRPWYLSWWALLLTAAAIGVVAWGTVTVTSWQSGRSERRLRALVDERTRELSEANQMLGERNVEMERFIYTVSHDLKSPLVTIAGFIGLLEADLEEGRLSEASDYVTRVKSSAARMARLVDELLEMSRVGRVRNEPQQVDTNALVAEVTTEMARRFTERAVETVVQPGLPTLYVDRSRLRQVIQNLLDNALKFLGDQGQPRVEVGGHRTDGRARLFVRDNGMGIAPELHEQAFDLFRRLHARIDGTGVGLSLVKRIVEVHGGRVWIESEGRPGRGTTVWLDLPAEPPATEKGSGLES